MSTPWTKIRFGRGLEPRKTASRTRLTMRALGIDCAFYDWPPANRRSVLCDACDAQSECRKIVLPERVAFAMPDTETPRYSHAGCARAAGVGLIAVTAAEVRR